MKSIHRLCSFLACRQRLGSLLIAATSASVCVAQPISRPTLSGPVPVDVPTQQIVVPQYETYPSPAPSMGSRFLGWFGKNRTTPMSTTPYMVAEPTRGRGEASPVRTTSLQSVEPSAPAPRVPTFLPSSESTLPSMSERRESLRQEGLSSPVMKEFTAESGTRPQAAATAPAESGRLRRLLPVRDKANGSPASPQGVLVLPEAVPVTPR